MDAKTLWDFKQRLEAEGGIVDTSFVDAPRQRNDRDTTQRIKKGERPEEFDPHPAVGRQKDSEARWTEKNNEAHSGWKNHVKVDLKTQRILSSTATPANVHDSQVFEELLEDKDQGVLTDSAYHSAEHEEHLTKLNAQKLLMSKATRGYSLSDAQQQTNTA